jgi:hypothetical protein
MRSRIKQMEQIAHQIDELNGRLGTLSKPILTDYGLLPYLWSQFVEFSKGRGNAPGQVYERQKFLYVVLLLYCPVALIGRRMRGGLRNAISEAIDVAGASISDNVKNVGFLYGNYRDFSRDVDYFYNEIIGKLEGMRKPEGS